MSHFLIKMSKKGTIFWSKIGLFCFRWLAETSPLSKVLDAEQIVSKLARCTRVSNPLLLNSPFFGQNLAKNDHSWVLTWFFLFAWPGQDPVPLF